MSHGPLRGRSRRMASRRHAAIVASLVCCALAGTLGPGAVAPAVAAPAPAPTARYFAATAQALSSSFLSYWLGHGQLERWGYPLTGQIHEAGRTVQYLERGRFEYNAAAPARISPSPAGRLLTTSRHFAPAAAIRATATATYFASTRHTLRGAFYRYWKTHGGLASFGAPISEEFRENGRIVQYFEFARFELGAAEHVALGMLGRELLALTVRPAKPPVPAAPARPAKPAPATLTLPTGRGAAPGFASRYTGLATWFPGNWPRIISLNESWGNLPWGYKGYGLYAAMPADLHLLGRWGRVTRAGKTIWVQFIDVIAWKDIAQVRAQGKVIDLGQESFAALAPLGDGVIRVTVDVAWPGFKPPGVH